MKSNGRPALKAERHASETAVHLGHLTDIKRDFETYNRVYAEYFSSDGPTRTTVEINRLPTPIAIELKCIAEIKKR